ncbi:YraN family protein [Aestuariivirga litoralis]|uniref:YraN family protein n=1 Tax=Aestuariivirga litoralis TaxID=2650924 RepID=UPI0018C4B0CE|nr:YraN family protein [Aestuariivirga litoralis]MBG1232019.1 YraN family protein [Aestuariivirga litoralis]
MRKSREQAERRGRLAEASALLLMRLKGYRLLARRFKTAQGEVDLIMRRGDTTAFIEVKARSRHDDAVTSVTPYQSRRIASAAGLWMARDATSNLGPCRFDIVAVNAYLWPSHIPNAFPGVF